MATATVYTINDDDIVVDQFDCDYNYAVGAYFGKPNHKGRYYVARKGIKIPYPHKKKLLKNLYPSSQAQE
jgi:hypothetical protein